MHSLVSIVILNYNGKKFNQACLSSVLQQSYTNFEIIFVDNASHDGSVEEVEKIFESEIHAGKIKIIKNKTNTGFSGGNNVGVAHADSKSLYICLLNNDTTVPSDRLAELISCIESDAKLWLVGSLVLDHDREQQLKDFYFKEHKTGLNNYLLEPAWRNQTPEEIASGVYSTTWIGWCSLLYKKALIDKPFPDYYFAYAEDTFLSLCILLTGHTLALCTKSVVYHYGSGSFTKKMTVRKAFHGIKNNLSNLFVFHSGIHFFFLLPVFFLYQLVKIVVSSPIKRTLGLIKALGWILLHTHELVRTKRTVQSITKITRKDFLAQLSPTLFENIYFLRISTWQNQAMLVINKIYKYYFSLIGILWSNTHD